MDASEMQEMREFMVQFTDQIIVAGEEIYNKLAKNPQLFAALAKCVRVMTEELSKEGFTRQEALAIATNYLSSIGASKK